MLAFK